MKSTSSSRRKKNITSRPDVVSILHNVKHKDSSQFLTHIQRQLCENNIHCSCTGLNQTVSGKILFKFRYCVILYSLYTSINPCLPKWNRPNHILIYLIKFLLKWGLFYTTF